MNWTYVAYPETEEGWTLEIEEIDNCKASGKTLTEAYDAVNELAEKILQTSKPSPKKKVKFYDIIRRTR